MRVVHVVHWPRSGIGVLLRDLVRHRSSDIEHTAFCIAPGPPITDQIRAAGAEVLEPHASARSWPERLTLLRDLTRGGAADLVHSHSLTPRILAALGAARVPHVSTVHAAYLYLKAPGLRSAVKRLAECAAARRLGAPYVCVSEEVLGSLPCAAMASRAVVIRNGTDIEAVRAAAEEGEASKEGDPLLVAVGRLDWEKAFHRLLEAVASVRANLPGVRLVVCGEGSERSALEAQAEALGIAAIVEFRGHVDNPMPLIRSADAFVSSSVQEGFALTAAEAMALGRPVVSTPGSGTAWLRDGENAIITDGFGSGDIEVALLRAFSNRKKLDEIAEAGRRFAETHLDVRRVVGEYEQLYREILARPRP